MTQILDGKIVRDKIAEELKEEISRLRSKIKLIIIQVGDKPESNTYIRQKAKFGEKIGAIVNHQKFPDDINQEELITQISSLNTDPSVHGIILQLPIPQNLDKDEIINTIDPKKDVDGQTAANIKMLFDGKTQPGDTPGVRLEASELTPGVKTSGFIPATTRGIFTLLDYYKIPVDGKHVVVIGRSTLVGKPTAMLALNKNATVTICHSKTQNLAEVTKTADVLIVAAGKPKLITKDHVTKGQIVIDVGINVLDEQSTINDKPETEPANRQLVGDVDFESVSKIVQAISPVPGGIGPMTVASLFQNLLEASIYQRKS